MRFSDIVGNTETLELLKAIVDNNQVPHALLFLGPKGSAKLAGALAMINYMLCTDKTEAGACGECKQCIKSQKFIHPDLHFSFPVVGANQTSNDFLNEWREFLNLSIYGNIDQWMQRLGAENKQANINKAECLNIIKKLSLKAFQSRYKFILLWLPEYLGREGNRLLKILEEPPEDTIIILVAEESERILNTILSRCQMIKFKGFENEDIARCLVEKGLDESTAMHYAYISSGNMDDALRLMAQKSNGNAEMLLEWLRSCFVKDPVKIMDWINAFTKIGRERQKQFLKFSLHFFSEIYRRQLIQDYQMKLSQEELISAEKMIKILDEPKIASIVEILNDCFSNISRNANPKILFMAESLTIHKVLRGIALEKVGNKV